MQTPDIELLLRELQFKATRSSGKGGQNVNKVSTKVEITFSIPESFVLEEDQKTKLLEKLATRINAEGVLRIVSSEERSQSGNKKKAIDKFKSLITGAFKERKKRVATKATRASKERRLKEKKISSEIKKLRRGL